MQARVSRATRGTRPPTTIRAPSTPCWRTPRAGADDGRARALDGALTRIGATRSNAPAPGRLGRLTRARTAKKVRPRRARVRGVARAARKIDRDRSAGERPVTDSETQRTPIPNSQRPRWTSLNGPWRFVYDDERRFLHPADDRALGPDDRGAVSARVDERSGIHDTGFHPCCWYERDFELAPDDGRTLLRFGAVDYAARVWVNGHLAATHEGGHTPFSADITALLDPSGRQTVTVMAFDDPHDLTKPRGKQDWQREPHAIWYPRTTGIWQTVWLERVGRTYVDRIRWTPHVETYAIRFEARIAGDPVDDLAIEVTLRHGERLLARDRYQVIDHEADRIIVLADPGIDDFRNELLWSPERPTLLDATVRLLAGDETIDEFTLVYRAALGLDPARPLHAQRPALPAAHGPRPGLLARHADGGAERRRRCAATSSWPRRWASTACASTRRSRIRAISTGPTGSACMVWEEMPSAYRFTAHRDQADDPRVERGDRARLQPSVRRRLGAVQRVVGRSRADRDAGAAPRRRGALPPDQDARRDPAGDRQRRLGEQRHRHHRHPRLRRQHRAPAPALRARSRPSSCSTGAVRAAGCSRSTAIRTAASRSC